MGSLEKFFPIGVLLVDIFHFHRHPYIIQVAKVWPQRHFFVGRKEIASAVFFHLDLHYDKKYNQIFQRIEFGWVSVL